MGAVARNRGVAERVEQLLGTAVASTAPVAGGDVATATRLRLADGRTALAKTRPGAPDDFFVAEARGLRWLAEPATCPVAEVLAVEADCLVLGWVEHARPSPEAAAAFGRDLAALHRSGAPAHGSPPGATGDGYVATLPLRHRDAPGWAEHFATDRLLPYLRLAVDRGRIADHDAAAVEAVVRRLDALAGEEAPSRLHGDLWSGNVVWSSDRAVLIDPAAHGGHRETDLALLALFGLPHLSRVLDAYDEAHPLADGWPERQPLHQLFPLLVHACLFGGRYGARAGDAARRLA